VIDRVRVKTRIKPSLPPDMGGPCTMTAIPRLFLAARPSGVRSIPRWRAIAAETGVISKSPTAMSLPAEWQKKLRHHRAYLTTKES